MDKTKLKERIVAAVEEYIDGEESYGDAALLCIDPKTLEVTIASVDEEDESLDCYDIMDFVAMDPESPGKWEPDEEAAEAAAKEYH